MNDEGPRPHQDSDRSYGFRVRVGVMTPVGRLGLWDVSDFSLTTYLFQSRVPETDTRTGESGCRSLGS